MLTRDIDTFFSFAKTCKLLNTACAKAFYLVTPEGFSLATQSAQDNVYMDLKKPVQIDLALTQHRNLAYAISKLRPAVTFSGRVETPDAVFPNNVFATINKRLWRKRY